MRCDPFSTLVDLIADTILGEVMKGDPGDLRPIGKVLIPFWCSQCHHEIELKALLYSLGIADILEDAPIVCPACMNDVRWLTEEEMAHREQTTSFHPIQPED